MKSIKKLIAAAAISITAVFSAWAFDKDYSDANYLGNFSYNEYYETEEDFNADFVNEYLSSQLDISLSEDHFEILTVDNFDAYAEETAEWIDAYIMDLYDIETGDCFYGILIDLFDEDNSCVTFFSVRYDVENSYKLIRFNANSSMF